MKRTPLQDTLAITKALADRQRVRILMLLTGGELCVCQIVEVMDLAASTISKHLSLLAAAGLVEGRKDGRWAYYQLPTRGKDTLLNDLSKWLRRALKSDASVREDAKKLHKVQTHSPADLCRQQRKRSGNK